MGGVAGHAGLFTTAADLAKFARAVLRRRRLPAADDRGRSPPEVAIRRAGGFDIDSALRASARRPLPASDSFGHTGWTGGFLWIDPSSRTFYIFLSNRVHPDGKGSVVALQRRLGTLVAESLATSTFAPPAAPRRLRHRRRRRAERHRRAARERLRGAARHAHRPDHESDRHRPHRQSDRSTCCAARRA